LKKLVLPIAILCVIVLTVGCAKSDAGITTAVKSRMATDDTVKAYQIDVDTREGVVTLSGNVESQAAKDQAAKLARETDGVKSVVDNIVVNPAGTPGARAGEAADEAGRTTGQAADQAVGATGDAAITAKVKSKFLADTSVAGLKIDVDTKNGVVTLSGTVKSAAERDLAVGIARGTDGVKSVVDKLTVG